MSKYSLSYSNLTERMRPQIQLAAMSFFLRLFGWSVQPARQSGPLITSSCVYPAKDQKLQKKVKTKTKSETNHPPQDDGSLCSVLQSHSTPSSPRLQSTTRTGSCSSQCWCPQDERRLIIVVIYCWKVCVAWCIIDTFLCTRSHERVVPDPAVATDTV